MKIIYGITKSNFGGAQRYVFDLAREARLAGHEVAVICGGNGMLIKELERNHIRVISLPHLKRDISLVDEIRSFHFIFRTLIAENPDVFHTNSSKMGGIGNFAARLAGVRKIIFTGHGWAFKEKRPIWQKAIIKCFVWATILLSHKTICVSNQTVEEIRGWPFIEHKLVVVKNGLAPFEFLSREEARAKLNIASDDLLVGTLAELHYIKGLDVLLKAWKKFSEKTPGKLLIIGEGEEGPHLQKLSHELGIENSVIFKGFLPNAREYLTAFDIFVLPSRSENLPYAILEAGLVSSPVIASRVGGIPEIIKAGQNGVLVEAENSEELFSSLLLLANDQSLRVRLGEKLKETVKNSFSLRQMIEHTFKTYL